MCRACNVLSQCSVSKPLPLEQESGPLLFALPKDCQDIVVDGEPLVYCECNFYHDFALPKDCQDILVDGETSLQ